MIRSLRLAHLVFSLSMAGGLAGCGALEPEGEEVVVVDGLEGAADSAGGRYVRVKGALTRGRTSTGAFTGSDSAYGYTLTAARGERLAVRGTSAAGMGLTSLYGPQREDGSWGPQRARAWTTFPTTRGVPTVGYRAPAAGRYLVVFSVSRRSASDPALPYALTACKDGQCTAGGCLEWSNDDESAHWAFNYASRAEASVLVSAVGRATALARAGACGAQPTTCAGARAPVCVTGSLGPARTFDSLCKAKVALRALVSTGLDAHDSIVTTPGTCAP